MNASVRILIGYLASSRLHKVSRPRALALIRPVLCLGPPDQVIDWSWLLPVMAGNGTKRTL